MVPTQSPRDLDRCTLAEDRGVALPEPGSVRQVLAEKSTVDCFRNRNLTRLLSHWGATHCVVYGLATEIAVRHAVIGLLQLSLHVSLVTDAVKELNPVMGRRTLNDAVRLGAHLAVSTAWIGNQGTPGLS